MKKKLIYLILITSIFILPSCLSIESERAKIKKTKSTSINNQKSAKMSRDYDPISLPLLIGMADLIVVGEVTDMRDTTFEFRIEEPLLNDYFSNVLSVEKFIPSKFDSPRPLAYANKQNFVLFLTKPKQENPWIWKIIGRTGEGEMPIDNGFVYFEGSYVQQLEKKPFKVQGVSRNIQRFDLDIFKDAIKNYTNCFFWTLEEYTKNNKKRQRWIPSRTCSDSAMKDYQTRSWIHNYLVVETNTKIPEKSDE